jgi:hypothetical protein
VLLNVFQGKVAVVQKKDSRAEEPGIGSGNYKRKVPHSYRKVCPTCGLKFKNLKIHILFKHERPGVIGWHIKGSYPGKPKDFAKMGLNALTSKGHPDLIDVQV